MRLSAAIFTTLITIIAPAALAGDLKALDPIIGEWVSNDGNSRAAYEPAFDGNWIASKMWFKKDGTWKLVGQGGIYRHTSDQRIVSVMRTTDMIGIELFETTITPDGDDFSVSNVAYLPDDSTIVTEEKWTFPETRHWNYTVFKIEDGKKTEWFSDGWVKADEQN